MGRRCAILQSNYVPWKGYFDVIAQVDEFILLDTVQYTTRDWRNRNLIFSSNRLRWLTIPVHRPNGLTSLINTVRVADPRWSRSHWDIIVKSYARAGGRSYAESHLAPIYQAVADLTLLSEVNRTTIEGICGLLEIETRITRAEDYGPAPTDRNDRLIHLCRSASADTYLTGPAAKAYVDCEKFAAAGIKLEFMDYSGYPTYAQTSTTFNHYVSIVDHGIASGIFNVRQRRGDKEWQDYLERTLDGLNGTSRKGFAFNCLTSYSDSDKTRPDLYYADPCVLFDL